jgi:hypothetical protein
MFMNLRTDARNWVNVLQNEYYWLQNIKASSWDGFHLLSFYINAYQTHHADGDQTPVVYSEPVFASILQVIEGMPRNATLMEVHDTLFPLYAGNSPIYSEAQIDRLVLSLLDVIDKIMNCPGYVWLEDVVKTRPLWGAKKALKPVNDKPVDKMDKKLVEFLVDNAVVDSLAVMTSVNPADTQTFMAATRTFMDGLDIQMDNIFPRAANAGGSFIRNDGHDDELELAIAASLRDF